MGNFKPLNANNLDLFLNKALELKCPNKTLPLLKNHRAMLYYPNPKIITRIMTFHEENKDWASMKEFYSVIGRK
jgi:hypothetical protein